MSDRMKWSKGEWVIRYVCMASAAGSLFLAIDRLTHQEFRDLPLLLGAAMVLVGISSVPCVLLKPGLLRRQHPAAGDKVLPDVASVLLAHGAYWLIGGIALHIGYWLLQTRIW